MGAVKGSGDGQSYAVSLASGTMAAALAAGSEIVQIRWTSTTTLCVVKSVRIWAGSIVAFTAGFVRADLCFARAWTAAGTGGGTATLTTHNGKRQTTMGTTAMGELRVATTAALGAGTKSLDSQALTSTGGGVANVAGATVFPLSELAPAYHDYPLVLAANEGLVIRATVPATGTFTFNVDVLWTERPV